MKWLLTSDRSAELIKSLECFTLLDGDGGESIQTLTGDFILYEWIKSHWHSYWTAQHWLMGFTTHFTDCSTDGRWNIPAACQSQQSIYPSAHIISRSSLLLVKETLNRFVFLTHDVIVTIGVIFRIHSKYLGCCDKLTRHLFVVNR